MHNNYIRANSLPSIDSYARAAAEWEKTKPIRGRGDTDTRPLGTLRAVDRFAIIRRMTYAFKDGSQPSYALRHHNTDVITYHPDGSITLDAWAGKTTDQFANRVLPHGVNAWFQCALGCAVILTQEGEDRLFLLGGNQHMVWDDRLRGYALEASETVDVYGIDRKAAGAALRATRYGDFMAWLKMKENLEPGRSRLTPFKGRELALAMLDNQQDWTILGDTISIEDRLRMAIYAEAGDVVTCDSLPYLTGPGQWGIYSEVRKVQARAGKYQHL